MKFFKFLKNGMISVFEKRDSEIDSLNGLRAFSIIAVMIFHLSNANRLALPQEYKHLLLFIDNLDSSVDLFFMLSGFLIYGILYKRWEVTGTVNFKEFYLNRTLRIFPAYYFYLAISISLATAQYKIMKSLATIDQARLAEYGAMIQTCVYEVFYLSNYKSTLNIHTWTLSLEEQFYLLFPITCYFILFRLSKSLRLTFLLGLFLFAILIRFSIYFNFNDFSSHNFVNLKFFHTRFDSILTGVISFELYKNWKVVSENPKRINEWLFFIPGIICLLFTHTFESKDTMPYMVFRLSIQNIGFALIVLASIHNSYITKFLSLRIFTPIARLSYGMYLWHFIAGLIGVSLLKFNVMSISWFVFTKMAIAAIISTLLFALFSYLFIEYPFLRLKSKIRKI